MLVLKPFHFRGRSGGRGGAEFGTVEAAQSVELWRQKVGHPLTMRGSGTCANQCFQGLCLIFKLLAL